MSASDDIKAGLAKIWGSAFVQDNPKKAYKTYHPAEYAEIAAMLGGGQVPITFTSDLGRGLAQVEAARRTLGQGPEPEPEPEPSDKIGLSYLRYGDGEPPPNHLTDYDTWITSFGGAPEAGASAAKRPVEYCSAVTCSYNWANVVEAAECRSKGWVLKAADGSELTNTAYGGSAAPLADPGNTAYQQAWAERVYARIQQHGTDGVFIDDCLRTSQGIAGKMSTKYPTMAQYEAAQVAQIAFVGQYLRSRGKYVLVNASGWVPGLEDSNTGKSDLDFWTKLAPHVSGLMSEYWMWHPSFPSNTVRREGAEWYNNWSGYMKLPALCEAQGVDFYTMNQSSIDPNRDYSLCSLLLETRGSLVIEAEQTWTPLMEKVRTIGNATAGKVKNGNRWQRQYQGGLVWVDPVAGTSGLPA